MVSNKLQSIREISAKIEADSLVHLKKNYVKVSQFHDGIYYDPDYISPVSKSAHNLNSKILIILQDWASYDYLNTQNHTPEKIRSGINMNLPTNKRLQTYLLDFFGVNFYETYAINLFPFIKFGNISAQIPISDYLYSIEHFIKPFIEIFEANLIIAIGSTNYNILRRFKSLSKVDIKDSASNIFEISNTIVLGVPHTGGMGTANAGGEDKVKKIWKSISNRYSHLVSGKSLPMI